MKTKLQSWFIPLVLLAVFTQTALAAVSFTVTPAAISNTYNGTITLNVTGLTNGDTVLVQKWLDANTNGVVDGGDLLFQQFPLTDGQASVFTNGNTTVTNFNVPGDTDGSANGSITANLYPIFNFSQLFVGKYLFVLSSPAGHFSPMTNSFSITNFPFPQSFAGTVFSNATSTTVPNAIIILNNLNLGGSSVTAGTVANNSGAYSINVPPGDYELMAIKTNYVANGTNAPVLTLGAGATISTNLTLTKATESISLKIVNANNSSQGVPGILVSAQTGNGHSGGISGLLGAGFTDTNGNATIQVNANVWKIEGNDESLAPDGYLALQNKMSVDTTTGSVSGVTIALPKVTAVFYGTVKDNFGNPLPGVTAIESEDNNGNYEMDGYTDQNGHYVAGAVGGLSDDQWQVSEDSSTLTNYVFSQGEGNITLSAGRAYQYNFTAILATNQITGNVQDSDGNPVPDVNVSANATINNINYNVNGDTDDNGNYLIIVGNGDWSVSLNCNGNDNSLDGIYGSGNYNCPESEDATVDDNNTNNVNFLVQLCDGIDVITTSPLPNGLINNYYYDELQASSCNGNFTWSLNDPQDFPSDLTFDSYGEIYGTPTNSGTYTFSANVVDGSGYSANPSFTLTISGPPVVLGSPSQHASSFQMMISGAANQNYALQMTTNLVSGNWITLFTTNNPTSGSFILIDPNATNKQRFYRVSLGP
jgi:hypothetical protein